MLTPRVLSNAEQAAVYFELDDYYVAGQQVAPSSWWGKGAEALELAGAIDRRVFGDLLAGRIPNGVTLAKGGTGTHRPGVDLTFSAPKSVSLAALVGGDERVLAAHERAVTTALEYLQETAPRARSKRSGLVRYEPTDNLIVARFNHDSSRALDPQLHTHAVVLNVTRRQDGAWKALSNEEIFRSIKAGGAIYRAELAHELRKLGYEIERTHADGRFELAGVSKDVLADFSQRRAQIVEHLERLGLDGPAAANVAARATRDPKQDVRRSTLLNEWRNRAKSLGLDFERIRRSPTPESPVFDRDAAEESLDHAIGHLSERKVIAAERQFLQVALGVGVGKARLEDLRQALARRLARRDLVPALSSRQKDPFARHYTTDRALANEQDLIHMMQTSRSSVAPILPDNEIDRALADITAAGAHPLTRGQQDAIRLALSTEDRLVGIQGYAGTGKTSGALLHIRSLAEAAGFEVHGFAPSAVAAEILERDAGIKSTTLARLLHGQGRAKSKKPQLWIIDEVSMMGNETARSLLHLAKDDRARLVWVGDRDQLPSIEAGRAFGLLMDHGLSIAEIDTIVRQRDPVLRKAVERTIARKHTEALDLLRPRIVEVRDREARLRAVADAFLELPDAERRKALVITPSNADRRRVNQLVRKGLRARRALSSEEADASILVGRDLTKAEARDPALYREGDVVRFNRLDRRLAIANGEYLVVTTASAASDAILLRNADGREIRWKPKRVDKVEVYEAERRSLAAGDLIRWTRNDNEHGRYNAELAEVISTDRESRIARISVKGEVQILNLARDRHWEHAYVSTVHAAQGRTADRLLLHLDSKQDYLLGHESWYVGISRAKNDIRLFTDDATRLPLGITRTLGQESALEVARRFIREPEREVGFEISR